MITNSCAPSPHFGNAAAAAAAASATIAARRRRERELALQKVQLNLSNAKTGLARKPQLQGLFLSLVEQVRQITAKNRQEAAEAYQKELEAYQDKLTQYKEQTFWRKLVMKLSGEAPRRPEEGNIFPLIYLPIKNALAETLPNEQFLDQLRELQALKLISLGQAQDSSKPNLFFLTETGEKMARKLASSR